LQTTRGRTNGWLIALGILALVLFVAPPFAVATTGAGSGWMRHWPMWEYGPGWIGGFWGVAMGAGMLLFWGAIVALIVAAVRGQAASGQRAASAERPIDTVRRRYAAGKITREDFLRISADIDEAPHRPAA
jgi:putative membrane protein